MLLNVFHTAFAVLSSLRGLFADLGAEPFIASSRYKALFVEHREHALRNERWVNARLLK